jgi:hypothetical protein
MPKTNPKNTDQKKKPTVKTQRGFDVEAAVRAGAGAIPSMLLGQIEYLEQQIQALQRSSSEIVRQPAEKQQLTPTATERDSGIKMLVSFPNESPDTECMIPGSRRRTPEEVAKILGRRRRGRRG